MFHFGVHVGLLLPISCTVKLYFLLASYDLLLSNYRGFSQFLQIGVYPFSMELQIDNWVQLHFQISYKDCV